MSVFIALSAAIVQAASVAELKEAVRTQNEMRLTKLLNRRPSGVNRRDTDGMSAIFYAVKYGHLEMAEILWRRGAKIRIKDNRGHTPLHWVSVSGDRIPSIRWLIEHEADVNAQARDGTTPLHRAAGAGQHEIVTILIAAGAEINAANDRRETPLMLANSAETVTALIAAGAELNAVAQGGQNALSYAMYGKNSEVAVALIRGGIDVEQKNRYGETALFEAVRQGQHDIIPLLIELGGIVRGKNGNEKSLLAVAAMKGDVTILQMILDAGISAFGLDEFKKKGLLSAAHTNRQTVQLLIDLGADINAWNGKDASPVHLAVQWDVDDVVECLAAHSAELDIFALAHLGHLEVLRERLAADPQLVHAPGRIGVTPLHVAAREGQVAVARFLIANNADVGAHSLVKNTPLNLAAMHNHPTLIRLLLMNGADVNSKGHNGHRPLHHAAEKGHVEAIELLLMNGAAVHAKDVNRLTALHQAAQFGHPAAIRSLLAAGAKIDTTVISYAHQSRNPEVIKLLTQY